MLREPMKIRTITILQRPQGQTKSKLDFYLNFISYANPVHVVLQRQEVLCLNCSPLGSHAASHAELHRSDHATLTHFRQSQNLG